MSASKNLDDIEWVQARSTVHIWDWVPDEERAVNLKDPEIMQLIEAGMLIVLNEETRALLPAPRRIDGVNTSGRCCGG